MVGSSNLKRVRPRELNVGKLQGAGTLGAGAPGNAMIGLSPSCCLVQTYAAALCFGNLETIRKAGLAFHFLWAKRNSLAWGGRDALAALSSVCGVWRSVCLLFTATR